MLVVIMIVVLVGLAAFALYLRRIVACINLVVRWLDQTKVRPSEPSLSKITFELDRIWKVRLTMAAALLIVWGTMHLLGLE